MRTIAGSTALFALLALLGAGHLTAQDVNTKTTYGEKTLTAGFTPDPFAVTVAAGGPVKTTLGGVNAYIAKAPDFRIHYSAGNFPLTIRVESAADTTLLINLPDGTWVANDDAAGTLNPLIQLQQPKSGRYEIWVGTVAEGINPPARLFVTERK